MWRGNTYYWDTNEPNDAGNGEDCVEMTAHRNTNWNTQGVWNDVPCNLYRYFMCKKGKKKMLLVFLCISTTVSLPLLMLILILFAP